MEDYMKSAQSAFNNPPVLTGNTGYWAGGTTVTTTAAPSGSATYSLANLGLS
jgi:hypothetical protein